MSDTDQSIYNIRYNQVTQGMEGFGGGSPMWTPLTLSSPQPAPNFASALVTGEQPVASDVAVPVGLTATLTASTENAAILITVSGSVFTGTSTQTIELWLAIDGVLAQSQAQLFIQGVGTAAYVPFSFVIVSNPGDVAPHDYALYALGTNGDTFIVGEAGLYNSLVVQEIH